MGGNHSDITNVEFLNSFQQTYYISSKMSYQSRNPIFVGYKRFVDKFPNDKNKSNNCYAFKLLEINDKFTEKDYEREKNILSLFKDFPEIIKYDEKINLSSSNKNFILIPMKYYPYTDLYNYFSSDDVCYSESLICQFCYQALQILQLLKCHNVVHNDIKLENFIVKSSKPLKIILTDFESSQIIDSNKKSDLFGGTPFFESPEMLRGQPHDYSSDLWSLAASAYMAFFGEYPFDIDSDDNEKKILKKVLNNKLNKLDDEISDDAWEFLTSILVIEPENRITVEDALKLNWFTSINVEEVKATVENISTNLIFENEINKQKC